MLLAPTDLVESSEDIMRAIFIFVSRIQKKKRILSSFFQTVGKVFMGIFNIYFSLRSNGRKIIIENISYLNWVCDSTIIYI